MCPWLARSADRPRWARHALCWVICASPKLPILCREAQGFLLLPQPQRTDLGCPCKGLLPPTLGARVWVHLEDKFQD